MDNLTQQPNEAEKQDLLSDDADLAYRYEYASQGQRFVNWLIDNLFMRLVVSNITDFLFSGFIISMFETLFPETSILDNIWVLYVFFFFISYINYIIYYTLCEKLFKGYTLGKLISGTRAIRQDGGELTFRNALLRSLSRCVPFEVFSGFSTLTWHDSWTDTMVVKTR